ncbi:T7SS effector LXG polymorphic toxin [Listeria sp. ILCC792]|uniref:T7SS effector LXG polymorphic toxin n=1 Tax=Listeria sp. ILCC792 TaxID=1918331 RepID=UPI000B58E6FD|nr:T7SS effector LXG polymorphic toxin [Listeria sp. ILCC792]
MSIDMYVSKSKNQAASVSKMCATYEVGFEDLQKAINDFVINSPALQGRAYDSAKDYFAKVLLPLAKGGMLLTEAVDNAVKSFPETYTTQVDSSDLKQSELETKIRQAEYLIRELEDIRSQLVSSSVTWETRNEQLSFNANILNIYRRSKQDLEEKLDKLLAFNASSPALFSEIASLEQTVHQGLAQARTAWSATSGTFIIPSDLSWTQSIHDKWDMRDLAGKSKHEFLLTLQEQFGFDEETAKQIYTLKEGLDKKFPHFSQQRKDYFLFRILGSISYEGFTWDQTAGNLDFYFSTYKVKDDGNIEVTTKSIEEIMKELGLKDEEIKSLRVELIIQNYFSGKVDTKLEKDSYIYQTEKTHFEKYFGSLSDEKFEELWNSYKKYSGKADYTHQMITMASNLNDNYFRLANGVGLIHGKGFNHEFVNELSGWRGDATSQAAGMKAILGNDDYKADLDAVNILHLMDNKKISYETASNQYYSDIKNGKYTRAGAFKDNVDFEYVKSEILKSETPVFEYTINGETYQTKFEERYDVPYKNTERVLTESERLNSLKEKSPASYNFIKSLENDLNELKIYAEEGK